VGYRERVLGQLRELMSDRTPAPGDEKYWDTLRKQLSANSAKANTVGPQHLLGAHRLSAVRADGVAPGRYRRNERRRRVAAACCGPIG
jgi:hypothetical protein